MNIVPFSFESHSVRAIVSENGEPIFVAVDVCACLDIANARDAVAGLDEDEKGVATIDTPGGPQKMAVINEPGLYSLVLRSRKPEAKAFKRWITHEVLPSLRKTGGYSVAPALAKPGRVLPPVASEYRAALATAASIPTTKPARPPWARFRDGTGRKHPPEARRAPRGPGGAGGWITGWTGSGAADAHSGAGCVPKALRRLHRPTRELDRGPLAGRGRGPFLGFLDHMDHVSY